MDTVPAVMVNLLQIPRTGRTQFIIRLHWDDRIMINRAAAAVGMKQAQFARTMLVQGAKAVVSRIGDEHINPPLISSDNQEIVDGEGAAKPLDEQEVRIAVNQLLSTWDVNWRQMDRTDAVDALVTTFMELVPK